MSLLGIGISSMEGGGGSLGGAAGEAIPRAGPATAQANLVGTVRVFRCTPTKLGIRAILSSVVLFSLGNGGQPRMGRVGSARWSIGHYRVPARDGSRWFCQSPHRLPGRCQTVGPPDRVQEGYARFRTDCLSTNYTCFWATVGV